MLIIATWLNEFAILTLGAHAVPLYGWSWLSFVLLAGAVRPVYVDRDVGYSYVGLALAAALVPWWIRTQSRTSRKDDVVAIERATTRRARPGDAIVFLPSRRREWLLSFPRTLSRYDDIDLCRAPA